MDKDVDKNLVTTLSQAIASLNGALVEELDKVVLGKSAAEMASTPEDISARYWLMQFLEPLNRKELKSFVDGFLVQLLTEDQAKMLVKFLITRFPAYYREDISQKPLTPPVDEAQANKITPPAEEKKEATITTVKV